MVKFKLRGREVACSVKEIYIPIWLNSNFHEVFKNIKHNSIYIPIWLNSNHHPLPVLLQGNQYLHSNMVKFKLSMWSKR